eukprot:gene14176-19021_t
MDIFSLSCTPRKSGGRMSSLVGSNNSNIVKSAMESATKSTTKPLNNDNHDYLTKNIGFFNQNHAIFNGGECMGSKQQENCKMSKSILTVASSSKKAPVRSPIVYSDRYVPNRANIDYDFCNHLLTSAKGDENNDPKNGVHNLSTPSKQKFNEEIQALSVSRRSSISSARLIGCFDAALPLNAVENDCLGSSIKMRNSNQSQQMNSNLSPKRISRIIQPTPTKVLDAPDLMNDYYLNLLHWGMNDIIAVALTQCVYLWHASDGSISQLCNLEEVSSDDYVSSVQWSSRDVNTIAVGLNSNIVQLWDSERMVKIRDLPGHSSRVSSLAWNPDNHILSSGGRDSKILNHDIRERNSIKQTYIGHTQEVCGLQWSPDGSTLASGGNENILCIWDAAMSSRNDVNNGNNEYSPRFTIEQHSAAVKAVAWCPWKKNILASGGGTADRTIRIWNTANGSNLNCVDTGSQVCAIQWSDTNKELVSSHGFSDNQLILWKYPLMTKIQEFRGHTARVLHLAKSPSGSTICSASADETLRFWEIFSPNLSNIGRKTSYNGNSLSSSSKKPRVANFLHDTSSMTMSLR